MNKEENSTNLFNKSQGVHMTIDLKELFEEGYCSFEIAKKIAKTGINPESFDLSYDENGNLCTGGWTSEITGTKFYPAVDFYQAVLLLEQVINAEPIMSTDGDQYFIEVNESKTHSKNRTDAICLMYLKLSNE